MMIMRLSYLSPLVTPSHGCHPPKSSSHVGKDRRLALGTQPAGLLVSVLENDFGLGGSKVVEVPVRSYRSQSGHSYLKLNGASGMT